MPTLPRTSADSVAASRKDPLNPKDAIGRAKPGIHAIPPTAILFLGKVMEHGKGKYGLYNWRVSPVHLSVYYDAAFRHLAAMWDGEVLDPESGEPHAAHVMGCMAVVLDAMVSGKLVTDWAANADTAKVTAALLKEMLRAKTSA